MKFRILSLILLCATPSWAAPGASGSGGMAMIVPWIAILGIFYFLLIRPQQRQAKEHQRMIDDVKRGDRILTQGGIYATVHAIKGKVMEVKLNDEVKVEIDRASIAKVVVGDPAQEAAPAANGAKA